LLEPLADRQPVAPDAELYNEDFAPVASHPVTLRTFSLWDIAALWVGLVVCVPTYTLVGSLVDLGFSAVQGLAVILVANSIVLVPMVLNAHGGTKYGVPFPVLARAAFGVRGANVPSMLRALVACGWFGIQTWVGAGAIHALLDSLTGGMLAAQPLPWLGISLPEAACFLAFWGAQVAIIVRGIDSIKVVEQYSAPILIALSAALFVWAVTAVGGFGPMLAVPSAFAAGGPKAGHLWATLLPALTANIGFWCVSPRPRGFSAALPSCSDPSWRVRSRATLSLNMPDFTRFAQTQRAQMLGQAVGLPLTMVAFSLVALVTTSATVVLYGAPITDPVAVLARMGGVLPTAAGLVGLIVATLSTNIAANVVAPANAFVNASPRHVTFRSGGLITAVVGMLLCPWRLIGSTNGFIFIWLVGYSALLGPCAGILLCDYFVVRRRQLDVDALYSASPIGAYHYTRGYNPAAMAALAIGVAPNVPGFLHTAGALPAGLVHPFWVALYSYAWFVGFALASLSYLVLMRRRDHAR
jgi:NCS1 family nucleobase:cation symporter-1